MNKFEVFNHGCSASVRIKINKYEKFDVNFELNCKPITSPPIEGSNNKPDAIRIRLLNDYMGPEYQDKILTVDEETTQKQIERQDPHVPIANIFTISEEEINRLNSLCGDCSVQTTGKCPVLESVFEVYGELNKQY